MTGGLSDVGILGERAYIYVITETRMDTGDPRASAGSGVLLPVCPPGSLPGCRRRELARSTPSRIRASTPRYTRTGSQVAGAAAGR